ncbi:unnamed protein product [Adineta steineri]|uniref:Uncharacterized protein n=1 Tax=Adineta steineri TaxID=433720 RepID=A0A814CM30_9BILA|nr:unnamed protein product [Adineta steineri]CAF0941866.1 unnamed protein product [Adineta steineri]CAF0975535.1 unnamed protein product [Adineta steineri]CAF1381339.1 unnamed protein product [Adineta steineri]CAF1607705.1 unnamed protein product [Adineta steineri]
MAQARVDTIIETWKTKAGLTLSAEEEEKLKKLFTEAVERMGARRQGGKELLGQLQAAVEANDSAKIEELLQKLREGFRKISEGREKVLDEFDQIVKPDQRARIVLSGVQRAKESGRSIEQVLFELLSPAEESS